MNDCHVAFLPLVAICESVLSPPSLVLLRLGCRCNSCYCSWALQIRARWSTRTTFIRSWRARIHTRATSHRRAGSANSSLEVLCRVGLGSNSRICSISDSTLIALRPVEGDFQRCCPAGRQQQAGTVIRSASPSSASGGFALSELSICPHSHAQAAATRRQISVVSIATVGERRSKLLRRAQGLRVVQAGSDEYTPAGQVQAMRRLREDKLSHLCETVRWSWLRHGRRPGSKWRKDLRQDSMQGVLQRVSM